MQFSDNEIEALIADIYNGDISVDSLPENLYRAIGKYIERGVYEGYGGTIAEFEGSRLELLESLRENVWLFSGAKTYHTVNAMSSGMINEDGELRSLKEFKEFAAKEFDLINKDWAKTEYETAIGQAQSAEKWQSMKESGTRRVRFSAVMDSNTTDICAALDGHVFDINDPELDVISPENHYNCRSVLIEELDDEAVTAGRDEAAQSVIDQMQDSFKMNPGKSGEIFSKDHPYFTEIAKSDREAANENFGFDIPEK